MRTIMMVALLIVLSGCGGGENVIPVSQAPIVQPDPPKTAIVFVGDSVTASWHLPDNVTNAGISGQYTPDMLARFDAVLALRPRIVEILGGTNEVRYRPDPNLDSVARMAELAAHSGACVIIGTIPPIDDWTLDTVYSTAEGNARVIRWNNDVRLLANAYGYKVADYYPAMFTDGSIDHTLFADTVHPNDAGHAVMWKVVSPLIDSCP